MDYSKKGARSDKTWRTVFMICPKLEPRCTLFLPLKINGYIINGYISPSEIYLYKGKASLTVQSPMRCS
jgi:hypothetical protein